MLGDKVRFNALVGNKTRLVAHSDSSYAKRDALMAILIVQLNGIKNFLITIILLCRNICLLFLGMVACAAILWSE